MKQTFGCDCTFKKMSAGKIIIYNNDDSIKINISTIKQAHVKKLFKLFDIPEDSPISNESYINLIANWESFGRRLEDFGVAPHSQIPHQGKCIGGGNYLMTNCQLILFSQSISYGKMHEEVLKKCIKIDIPIIISGADMSEKTLEEYLERKYG